VGRGSARSYCILIAPDEKGDVERLSILAETDDGFTIAEEDLRLRGEGEFAGTQQAGGGGALLGSVVGDFALYMRAKAEADALVSRDPDLLFPEHGRLRALLDAQAQTRATLVSS
jgi:ATP-dependent DNA helicase RecG